MEPPVASRAMGADPDGNNWELSPAPAQSCAGMQWGAKELSDSLPLQVCQEVHKNVIVSQLLVIIFPFTMTAGNMYVCVYKGEYHSCAALASPWPFSNNNRLNIKRQKQLLGSLSSAKENE